MFSGAMRGGAGPTPSRSPSHPRSALWGVGARGRVCKRAGRAWGPREERSLAGPWTFRPPPCIFGASIAMTLPGGRGGAKAGPSPLGGISYILTLQGALWGFFSAPCQLPEIPLKRDLALAPPPLGSVHRRYLARHKSDVTWGLF